MQEDCIIFTIGLKSPLGFLLLKSCANRSLVKLLIRTVERGYKLQASQFPELFKNLVQLRDINISYKPYCSLEK